MGIAISGGGCDQDGMPLLGEADASKLRRGCTECLVALLCPLASTDNSSDDNSGKRELFRPAKDWLGQRLVLHVLSLPAERSNRGSRCCLAAHHAAPTCDTTVPSVCKTCRVAL